MCRRKEEAPKCL